MNCYRSNLVSNNRNANNSRYNDAKAYPTLNINKNRNTSQTLSERFNNHPYW